MPEIESGSKKGSKWGLRELVCLFWFEIWFVKQTKTPKSLSSKFRPDPRRVGIKSQVITQSPLPKTSCGTAQFTYARLNSNVSKLKIVSRKVRRNDFCKSVFCIFVLGGIKESSQLSRASFWRPDLSKPVIPVCIFCVTTNVLGLSRRLAFWSLGVYQIFSCRERWRYRASETCPYYTPKEG